MPLLYYLSYVAILAAFGFVTLSLASGLLYISELIEEHSRNAKVIGIRGIYGIIALQCILYFSESLPTWHTIFSIFCHVIYLQNFSHTWPLISLSSPSLLASGALVIIDHFLWFFYFAHVAQEARHTSQRQYAHQPAIHTPGFAEIATFFAVCVWLAPLFLFLSLSANDNALPTSAALSSNEIDPRFNPSTASRSSLFKSVFSSIFARLPVLRRKSTPEGIIAPPLRSKNSFRRDSSPGFVPRSSSIPPPPRSPALVQRSTTDVDSHLLADFKLSNPPTRSLSMRRVAGEQ